MNIVNLLPVYLRLSASSIYGRCNISTQAGPLYFGVTNVLLAEPLKKKKRLDPSVLRAREERKRKKIEKQIRRLEKCSQQYKPIKEIEVPYKLKLEKEQRIRDPSLLSSDEIDRRQLLFKEWTKYKTMNTISDTYAIDSMLLSQRKALQELKFESEELYNEAIQIDACFLPYSAKGPVRTPPIEKYNVPDGINVDITRKYDGE